MKRFIARDANYLAEPCVQFIRIMIKVITITMCIHYDDSKGRSCINASWPSMKLLTEGARKVFHDDDYHGKSKS